MKSNFIGITIIIVMMFTAPLFSQTGSGMEVKVEIDVPWNDSELSKELLEFLSRGPENPIWSPDGETLAFTGYAGYGIWTVPVEGGKPKLVYDNVHSYELNDEIYPSQGDLWLNEFSADGSEILFVDFSAAEENMKEGESDGRTVIMSANPRIKYVDIDTGETNLIRNDAAANSGCMTSDGRYLVYNKWQLDNGKVSANGLYVFDTVTGEDRFLAEGSCPDVSPDDEYVIYTDLQDGYSHSIYEIPLAGGEPGILASFTTKDEVYHPVYVQYSQDGQWILFIGSYRDYKDTSGFYHDSDTRYHGLCVLNTSSGDTFMISPNTTDLIRGYARWSPDGTKICYTVRHYEGISLKSEIRILDFNPESFMKTTEVGAEVPMNFAITGNYPNPFNPTTTIEFSLPEAGFSNLVIYNMMGQKVRDLVTNSITPGVHSVLWDGCDDRGSAVSSGIYICRLKMEGKVTTKQMMLFK